jgi:hypothetical protein
LQEAGELHSEPIRLKNVHHESGPLVLKLIGSDSRGHRVAAWARINQQLGEHEDESQPPVAGRLGG